MVPLAGIDMTYHFASTIYGEELSNNIVNIMEYEVHKDASWDPFAEVWNVKSGGIGLAANEG